MSNFPTNLDDDVTLPRVDNNITEIGDAAINALRDAAFNIESNIGIGAQGTKPSIADRFSIILDSGDNIQLSFLAQLPQYANIVNSQISMTAGITESKLDLDYNTAYLYNLISNFNTSLNTALNFITNTGSKFEPHLKGITYRHTLSQIDVASSNTSYLKNQLGLFRNNTNAYTVLADLNSDYIAHQTSNGTSLSEVPPTNYAHVAAGISLKSENFASIPQITTDVQKLADYLDSAGILTIGTRIQTLFQNGIPRASRANTLVPTIITTDALSQIQQGKPLVPITTVTTYLSNSGNSTVDDINTGDDIIQFTPSSDQLANNLFDSQFSVVSTGDILSINYGSVVVSFIIKEVKYITSGSDRIYVVRINGKNLLSSTTATARVDKSLFNTNKFGELAVSAASSPVNTIYPSLIVSNPRGAQVLGNGFNPNLLDQNHYNLYLSLYPTGNPADGITTMTAIDVTGNAGTTPGKYTLNSVIESINKTFRKPGFNFRFVAFAYQGNFGIMLADSINGVSFSIIDGVLGATGVYDQSLSNTSYALNIIDLFNNIDPLGLGPNGSNVSSPPYSILFNPVLKALNPMKLHVPLGKNTYYVNGAEKEKLNTEPFQLLDQNKDGYWPASITNKLIIAGTRVQTTYTITGLDLSTSGLKSGKTIVVQPETGGTVVDFGRFTIETVEFKTCDGYTPATTITVYDAVHSVGSSPYVSSGIGTVMRVYLSSDSVSFNSENATDTVSVSNYKRHFETYIDSNALTFTHERARFLIGGTNGTINSFTLYASSDLSNFDIYSVSPKLRGYALSQNFKRINLQISQYSAITGVFDGYLCNFNGTAVTNQGPITSGKKGEIVRFYDETNVDYIDFILNIDSTASGFSSKNIDIQLFSSLSLDEDIMELSTCQINDLTKDVLYLRDTRQFGNVSEKQLSNSAIDFINAGNRLLHQNGVIKGFDVSSSASNKISLNGGTVVINGKIIESNNMIAAVPLVQEVFSTNTYTKINWALCLNSKNDYEFIALTDYDATSPVTPNSNGRIVTAINPITTSTYNIESRSFAEIIKSRKDVIILYVVTSIVDNTGALTTLSYRDARKFSFEIDSIIDPVLTSEKSQGSFYSFDSLATWIIYNSNYSNSIGIKGNSTIANTYVFNTGTQVNLNGNGSSTLTFGSGSNVTFNNFNFNDLPIVINSGATVTFNNCTFDPNAITINSGATVSINNSSLYDSNIILNQGITLSNVKMINSTITVSSVSGITIAGDIFANNCTLVLNQSLTLTGNSRFSKSVINVNSSNGIIANGNTSEFDACSIVYNSTSGNALVIGGSGTGIASLNGNIFDKGTGAYNNSIVVTNVPVTMTNNKFQGIVANLNAPMVLCNTDSIITGNSFFRGGLSLGTGTYLSLNNGTCIVTENFFDGYTVDGINETLIGILGSANIVYEKNKNQTGYKAITLTDFKNYPSIGNVSDTTGALTPVVDIVGTKTKYAVNESGQVLPFIGDITHYLPSGVNVLYAVVGTIIIGGSGAVDNTSFPDGSNNLSITLCKTSGTSFSTSNPPSSFLNSMVDVFHNTNYVLTNYSNNITIDAANIPNFQTATQYCYVDISSTPINTSKNNIVGVFQIDMNTTGSAVLALRHSPMLIKYRW